MITPEEESRYAELQAIALDCARKGNDCVLEPMLEAGMPVNLRDEKGNTLLMLASYHGHAETVRLLLSYEAEVDARNDRGQTPLAGVAFKGHTEMARLLLNAGADPAADQGGGRTPIMFAAMFGNKEIVEILAKATQQTQPARWLGIRLHTWARITSRVRQLFARPTKSVA